MSLTPELARKIEEAVSENYVTAMLEAKTPADKSAVLKKAFAKLDEHLQRVDLDTKIDIIAKATDYPIFTLSHEIHTEAKRELTQRQEDLLLYKDKDFKDPAHKAKEIQAYNGLFAKATSVITKAIGGTKALSAEERFLNKQNKSNNKDPEHRDKRHYDESQMPKFSKKNSLK